MWFFFWYGNILNVNCCECFNGIDVWFSKVVINIGKLLLLYFNWIDW